MRYTAHITKIKHDKKDSDVTKITLETTNRKCKELKPGQCLELKILPGIEGCSYDYVIIDEATDMNEIKNENLKNIMDRRMRKFKNSSSSQK